METKAGVEVPRSHLEQAADPLWWFSTFSGPSSISVSPRNSCCAHIRSRLARLAMATGIDSRPHTWVRDIAVHLPEQVISNADLAHEYPAWDMDRVAERAGILSRHVARPDETALDLALVACNILFERNPNLKELVDGILFCTQTADYIMPPNACVLHRALALPAGVFAFDTNLACSGYVYALALAQGLIVANTCKNILLVTADTYSKLIHPSDRSARTLFGDGAAVSWVTASEDDRGVVDLLCETSGIGFENFYVPAGGCRNPRTPATAVETRNASGNVVCAEYINMDGMGVLAFVNTKIPGHVRRLLERNRLTIADIDLFVFHQASKLALDSLSRALKLPSDKVFRNMANIGNTVSASIPISLAEASAAGRLRPGSKILLCGFGVGLSWASALVQV